MSVQAETEQKKHITSARRRSASISAALNLIALLRRASRACATFFALFAAAFMRACRKKLNRTVRGAPVGRKSGVWSLESVG